MNRTRNLFYAFAFLFLHPFAQETRQQLLFNTNWRFHKGDVAGAEKTALTMPAGEPCNCRTTGALKALSARNGQAVQVICPEELAGIAKHLQFHQHAQTNRYLFILMACIRTVKCGSMVIIWANVPMDLFLFNMS